MEARLILLGTLGVFVANIFFGLFRSFAHGQGLEVSWFSRGFSRERRLLRDIVRKSGPSSLGRRARNYLRLEILAWVIFAASAGAFVWGFFAR
jgi:hypothetical protein